MVVVVVMVTVRAPGDIVAWRRSRNIAGGQHASRMRGSRPRAGDGTGSGGRQVSGEGAASGGRRDGGHRGGR